MAPSALTRLTRDGRSLFPSLSPDGKLLAFASFRDGNNLDIYVQQFGSSPIRLTVDPALDSTPAFSADGSKIYFSSSRTRPGIYEVPALGGDSRLLIADASRPKPSPSGAHITYLRGERWYLDTLPPTKALTIAGVRNRYQTPVWSPDGSKLLIRKKDFEVISVTGEHLQSLPFAANLTNRRLTQSTHLEMVRWLSNDDLLFVTGHGDAANLWRIPLSEAAEGVPSAVTAGPSINITGADAVGKRAIFSSSTGSFTLWSLPCDLNTGKVNGPLKTTCGSD